MLSKELLGDGRVKLCCLELSEFFFFFFKYVPSRLVVSVDVEPGEREGVNDLPLPFLGALWWSVIHCSIFCVEAVYYETAYLRQHMFLE